MTFRDPILLASYPRSGSTWLRFILCNLLHPEVQHTFDTVNHYMPGLDDPNGVLAGVPYSLVYKTHMKRHSSNVLLLHRHVGDVLESEWWYKQKFHGEERSFRDYLEATNYGQEWREFNDWYFPATVNLRYADLGSAAVIGGLFPAMETAAIDRALAASSFAEMQKAEELGFGIYPEGDKDIKFVRKGTSGQWQAWAPELRMTMLEKNQVQLRMLGYA